MHLDFQSIKHYGKTYTALTEKKKKEKQSMLMFIANQILLNAHAIKQSEILIS